ncbi:MAG: cation:proton antiporter [Verrucomicrobia bacterium]|nr:cation:proton antiporter [Verrucomicrobiota bacterium]
MILAAVTSSLVFSPSGRAVILTLAGALALTLLCAALSRRLRVPSIILFMLAGLCMGQFGLHLIRPENLGQTWEFLLMLGTEIVLFAAGLCLPPRGYRETTWETRGILTSGVLITWGLVALTLRLLIPAHSWSFCLLCASLVLSPGPAVIAPLLQRLHLRQRVHHVLYWESVLCDPIGAVLAILCFHIACLSAGDTTATVTPLIYHSIASALLGIVGGRLLAAFLRLPGLSGGGAPVALLAGAVVIPATSDYLMPGSGLLSALVAGLALGRQKLPTVLTVRRNRALLMESIAGPVILLAAAHFSTEHARILGWRGLLAILVVLLVVRPLNVFLSTAGGSLRTGDKLFLSWLAPRGVVPAVLAAAFAMQYAGAGASAETTRFMEAFVFVLIAASVAQGLSAGIVGRRLDVLDPHPTGWLIVGGHMLGRQVAAFIRDSGLQVVIVDEDAQAVAAARRERQRAITGSALAIALEDHPELYGVGHLLAITDSSERNLRICRRFAEERPDWKLYRWAEKESTAESAGPPPPPGQPVWTLLRAEDMQSVGEEADEPGLDIQSARVSDIRHPERVLLSRTGSLLTPSLPSSTDETLTVLIYRPLTVGLDLNVLPEWIS